VGVDEAQARKVRVGSMDKRDKFEAIARETVSESWNDGKLCEGQ
jgi:hypothetical protein